MCELRHHPCDDFVTHKMCMLPAKWIRQPASVALSTETIYAAEAGSVPPLSRTYPMCHAVAAAAPAVHCTVNCPNFGLERNFGRCINHLTD